MLELNEISKFYGADTACITALNNVSLMVGEGDFLAVMGPSGSGKSTFLNIIGGLDYPSKGAVIFRGKRIDNLDEDAFVDIRRGEIAYVFQQYHLIPSLTALENVLLPLSFCGKDQESAKALDLLKRVGLEKRADHRPCQLSGGEQQRVAIARALINAPSLILADEPTGNMDQKTGADILDLFTTLNREGHTIIMVTHSPEIAGRAREIVFLRDGQIEEKRKTKEITIQ